MLLRDVGDGSLHETLEYLHKKLTYLVGRVSLSQARVSSETEDTIEFLRTCSDAHFLDAVEYVLHTDAYPCLRGQQKEVVNRLNEFMSIDDLPYFVTKQVWETLEGDRFAGRHMRILEESKVIPKDSQVIHESAVEPALQLLSQPAFRHANTEFMAALEDFRHHKFGDCVTKCNSSYESVMKVICGQKGFEYSQGDTTARLLKSIMGKTEMDSFWESPLLIVGTLRNKLGSAHGAGEKAKVVPEHVARYTLNMTASAIVFLHDQAYTGN